MDGPVKRGHFSLRRDTLLTTNLKRPQTAVGKVVEPGAVRVSSPVENTNGQAYQMLLTKKPNRGCWATSTVGGPGCFFAILRFWCSFGAGFFWSDGSSCANASRTSAEMSATVPVAGDVTTSSAAAAAAVCTGAGQRVRQRDRTSSSSFSPAECRARGET